ncbi:hypothetical protein FQZ97_841270 [compost metagenome]
MEQPQRLLIDRAQALQSGAAGGIELALLAALHQGDLDLAIFRQQPLEVVPRTGAGHEGQLETLLGQLLLELLGKDPVTATLGTGGHAGAHRRRRGDEIEHRTNQGGQHRDYPQVGQEHDLQVFEHAAHGASLA